MIDKEAVRKDRAAGMRYADIAEKHGCSKQYIGLICRGYNTTWTPGNWCSPEPTDANVYKLEHELILNTEIWSFVDKKEMVQGLFYIAGINTMAQAVVEALREVKDV